MLTTKYGPMDEALIEKRQTVVLDNENECTSRIDYYLDGELVGNGIHVHLKRSLAAALGMSGEQAEAFLKGQGAPLSGEI